MFELAAVKAVLGIVALVGDRLFHRTKVRKNGRDVLVRRTHTGTFAAQKRAIGLFSFRLGWVIIGLTAIMVARWVMDNEQMILLVLMVVACSAAALGALILLMRVVLRLAAYEEATMSPELRELLRQRALHPPPDF